MCHCTVNMNFYHISIFFNVMVGGMLSGKQNITKYRVETIISEKKCIIILWVLVITGLTSNFFPCGQDNELISAEFCL